MGELPHSGVQAGGIAMPADPYAPRSGSTDLAPGSWRLRETLQKQDRNGERAIAIAQGAIALFVLILHAAAQLASGFRYANPWVLLALSALLASSTLRFFLSRSQTLPERALDTLNVVDIVVFLGLVWSYQFAYHHPAGGVLKAPSLVLMFVLVAARALRFHPRPVLLAGGTAAAGWALVVLLAVLQDGTLAVTHSYPDYLTSYKILVGAEIERLVALGALVLLLGFATYKARAMLSRAAHASDYAEALEAARRHLEEAAQARTHLDAALNNIVQGLAMFDSEQRLVLCNERYAEIYGLTPAQVHPGTTLLQIIERRMENGLHSELAPDEIVSGMLRRRDGDFGQLHSQLSDGRCIAITVRPMADGGTVTTHQDITEQRRSEAKIRHMARHDALTGLPNRVHLNERVEHALVRAERGDMIATHLLDLDHFKNVNDTLGHAAGDKLLTMVAERLRPLVGDTDTVARMGGDEFAILQVGVGQPADASALAYRIIDVVSEPYDIEGQQVNIGTSVGIAIGPGDGGNPDLLMRNADLALYRAKGDGRGAFRFFEPEMDAEMQERRILERDLRQALASSSSTTSPSSISRATRSVASRR